MFECWDVSSIIIREEVRFFFEPQNVSSMLRDSLKPPTSSGFCSRGMDFEFFVPSAEKLTVLAHTVNFNLEPDVSTPRPSLNNSSDSAKRLHL